MTTAEQDRKKIDWDLIWMIAFTAVLGLLALTVVIGLGTWIWLTAVGPWKIVWLAGT